MKRQLRSNRDTSRCTAVPSHQLTAADLDKLIAVLDDVQAEPCTHHLTTDECTRYVSDTLSPEEITIIDDHLASCEACCNRLIETLESISAPNQWWVKPLALGMTTALTLALAPAIVGNLH